MKIQVGLTGWGDHDDLYQDGVPARKKLERYAEHFSIVEVDSSFYAVQPARNYEKWVQATPPDFSFVVKAYQGMTGHLRGKNPFSSPVDMFQAFKDSIQPVAESGKLKAVLFQFPPWFDCTRPNVEALKYIKHKMDDMPLALEFRHQSWFTPEMREKTLTFMNHEGWIHSICDEPQAGVESVPIVLHPTSQQLTIVRFHGRNVEGWSQSGNANWREIRYLYHYSREELTEWVERIEQIKNKADEICLLFNNNSGGHAASNAKDMMGLLGMDFPSLPVLPEQLKLF